jgi:4-amino-4-deoxy-L-arabinose transferase-like glycosyltransferase
MQKSKIKLIIILVVILGIAAFFRFWQLNQTPPGLYPDVAINGINALDSIAHKDFKVFYPDNNGREGVFFWLIALSFLIFGPSILTMKLVAAIIGFFTVLGTYLLAKELFKNYNEKKAEYIALLASFFLAISFWHTNFSRIGFRAIMVPFCLVFAFYFLFKGFRAKKIWPFIIAGVFFGLGFYTYISYRFVVFVLATAFISWWLVYKRQNQQKVFIRHALYSLIATFIVALPIGIYFLLHPADFFGLLRRVLGKVFSELGQRKIRPAGEELLIMQSLLQNMLQIGRAHV